MHGLLAALLFYSQRRRNWPPISSESPNAWPTYPGGLGVICGSDAPNPFFTRDGLRLISGGQTMKNVGMVIFVVLVFLGGGLFREMTDECARSLAVCEQLTRHDPWQQKVYFGILNPEFLEDIVAEINQAMGDGNISAAIANWQIGDYFKATEGCFAKWGYFDDSKPFAVYTFNDSGDGLVLYKSGWAFQVGSRIHQGMVTGIYADFMITTDDHTNEETIINFYGPYLSGRVVDADGIGLQSVPLLPEEDIAKTWKRG